MYKEELHKKFAPLYNGDTITTINNDIKVGVGLHDSSAALITYLISFNEPFVLLSTGTWCISLNPFNHSLLTDYELNQDCLSYLNYKGKPVKASRLFAGYAHEEQIKRIADYFHKNVNYYKTIVYDDFLLKKLQRNNIPKQVNSQTTMVQQSAFEKRSLNDFESYEEAYYKLMLDIITQQVFSTKLVLNQTDVKRIFVDGGFSKNDVYMHLLAAAFPYIKVYAANIAQASSLGAAFVLHDYLNKDELPSNLIELKYYTAKNDLAI